MILIILSISLLIAVIGTALLFLWINAIDKTEDEEKEDQSLTK